MKLSTDTAEARAVVHQLVRIKAEVDRWQRLDGQGLGRLTADMSLRRVAVLIDELERLLKAERIDQQSAFGPDAIIDTERLYDSAVSPGEEERLRETDALFGCQQCWTLGRTCPLCEDVHARVQRERPPVVERRTSMSTLIELRSRSWLRWVVMPLAWTLLIGVAALAYYLVRG